MGMEHLPSMYKTLGSIPSTAKKKERRKETLVFFKNNLDLSLSFSLCYERWPTEDKLGES